MASTIASPVSRFSIHSSHSSSLSWHHRGFTKPLASSIIITNSSGNTNTNNGSFARDYPANVGTGVKSTMDKLQSLLEAEKTTKSGEKTERSVGLSILNEPRCYECEKGLVLCTTCAGSGLYVDSILESQGIIVKVCCLGCGGSGSILCLSCGGRGHV